MRVFQRLLLTGLLVAGLVIMLAHANKHDLELRQLTYKGVHLRGPKGEAKIGDGDRFRDGETFPFGTGIKDDSENSVFRRFETILSHKEVDSAMKGLRKEYGILLATPPWASFEGRKTTIGMIPCESGDSCGLPSTYSAYFTGALLGRERGTSDAIIYFLSDLLYARKHGTGLSYGSHVNATFTNAQVLRALSVGIVFYPLVNANGVVWDQERDACWRRNRNTDSADLQDTDEETDDWKNLTVGVSVNRNFDFAFDFTRVLDLTYGVMGNSNSPLNEFYQGRYPFSESESCNVAWVFDVFPNISWFMDVRTFGRRIFHPWGIDLNQVTDPEKNWRNEAYDGQRGNLWNAAYGEYMDRADNDQHRAVAQRIALAMEGVADKIHSWGEPAWLYPQTGGVMDWAYARHIVDSGKTKVMSFTMEIGNVESEAMENLEEVCPFYPTVDAFNIGLREAAVGMMTFLLEVAENTR